MPTRRFSRHGLRLRRHRKPAGTAPGTLVYEGEPPARSVRIRVIDYDSTQVVERELEDVAECERYRAPDTVTWIDVDGVHDTALVERLGRIFEVHPLTLEDIVGVHQRAKVEEYPGYAYLVIQMMRYEHEHASLEAEQVSLVFGEGFLLSFQESVEHDLFEPVRKRLRDNRGRARQAGADFLAYALLDVVVDHYMDVLEGLGEHMERLEDALTTRPTPEIMHRVSELRRQVIFLRRAVWPVRDVFAALERSSLPSITPETRLYLRDTHDHAIRTAEMVESARDVLASLTDLHVSMVSFRLNEIMKILAVIATFFLPLTFIAGVYGMNFNTSASPLNMPELDWFYGYPFALVLMVLVAAAMYAFFRRRNWL